MAMIPNRALSLVSHDHHILRRLEALQRRRQLDVLGTFVPNEILNYKPSERRRSFVGVLLFADVSGFTPLTEKYNKTGKGGIYRLTATLNAYIGAIVEVIHFFGGDILKFSGDAFLALWKVKQGESVYEVLHKVVVCALIIQKNLGIFETEVNVLLKVKLAISCGNMTFAVIGSRVSKYYVIIGEAIYAVKDAENVSVSGDVVIAPVAWSHMLQARYQYTELLNGNVKILSIIYMKNEESLRMLYEEKAVDALKLIQMHLTHRSSIHDKRSYDSNFVLSKTTHNFEKSLPKRVEILASAKNWDVDALRPFIIKPVQDQIDESQPVEYLTEMREITIQFINILPMSRDTDDLIPMCDSCYKIIFQIVGEALGVVNKVSLFDKDFMILVLFGLRGIRHEMESQHALRSAFQIRKMIVQSVANVESCSIGITQGLVYCGVVGHPFRREYSVIGTEVNKAARIMCAYPSKVICDHKSFKHSKMSSYYFELQPSIKLKGIEDAGNIFEYNEDFDDTMSKSMQKLKIFGRTDEFNMVRSVVYKVDDSYLCDFNGICFNGPRKIGKTAILLQAVRTFRKEGNCQTIITIELNSKSNIPYFSITRLYDKLYDKLGTINEDNSVLLNLPRQLYQPEYDIYFPRDDVGVFKYNILNRFRRIIDVNYSNGTIIVIDNIEYIDLQSWEILEIVFNENTIKLIVTACFNECEWNLEKRLSKLSKMYITTVAPIPSEEVAALACMFLAASGVPDHLVYLLIHSCEGRPGYIQSSILRLVNNGSLQLKVINRSEIDTEHFVFPVQMANDMCEIISIVEFSDRYKLTGQELTWQAISMDLFDSFTPYQQLIIKTAAVLGGMFNRSLLIFAMQYPSENQLSKELKQLFEEEVFECGSKYMYALDIDSNTLCCRCNFSVDAYEEMQSSPLPKYAYCKLIHFKNKSIREVAYELLPGNQKKELHLRCTEVIEKAEHTCPICHQQPIVAILNMSTYHTIMQYCLNPQKKFVRWKVPDPDYGDMKQVVKSAIQGKPFQSNPTDIWQRPHHNPKVCRCYEIRTGVLMDLRNHADCGKHSGKLVYFTMQYGFMLMLVRDYKNAIRYFREAIELCLIDADQLKHNKVMTMFKRIVLGRTEIALTQSHLALGQVQIAKNHLAIALRQYNIPSLALEYHVFSELILRRFIVNRRHIFDVAYANTLMRFDCGNALAHCAKIFALEGKWDLARRTSLSSLQLLKSVNPNMSLLSEVYCNIVELYSFANNSFFEKLQKYVFQEISNNFSTPDVANMNSLITLMETLFETYFMKNSILKGIRLGYRLLNICIRIDFFSYDGRLFYYLSYLLICNNRIRDAGDILRIFKRRMHLMDKICENYYYISAMLMILVSGFYIEKVSAIIRYANEIKSSHKKVKKIHEVLFTLVQVYFVRMGSHYKADEWYIETNWSTQLLKHDIQLLILIFSLECRISRYLHHSTRKNSNMPIESKRIHKQMALLREACKAQYSIFSPNYMLMKAWLLRVKKKSKEAFRVLKNMRNSAARHNNIIMMCYAEATQNIWSGGFTLRYAKRPIISYLAADRYNFQEVCQFIHTYEFE